MKCVEELWSILNREYHGANVEIIKSDDLMFCDGKKTTYEYRLKGDVRVLDRENRDKLTLLNHSEFEPIFRIYS